MFSSLTPCFCPNITAYRLHFTLYSSCVGKHLLSYVTSGAVSQRVYKKYFSDLAALLEKNPLMAQDLKHYLLSMLGKKSEQPVTYFQSFTGINKEWHATRLALDRQPDKPVENEDAADEDKEEPPTVSKFESTAASVSALQALMPYNLTLYEDPEDFQPKIRQDVPKTLYWLAVSSMCWYHVQLFYLSRHSIPAS